jgi:transposase-like protein
VNRSEQSDPKKNEAVFPENMIDFLEQFGSEEACLAYLCKVRWPQGFVCPECSGRQGWKTSRGTVFCGQCQRQTSPTARTILHNSRTDLRKWFLAAWLFCTQKTGVSAKTLQRELKVGYKTAWLMLQKLRQATIRAERSQLTGSVEVDETFVGGQESGVVGRQAGDKALVVIAVELEGKKVGRVRLRLIPDASGASLVGFLKDCVTPGTTVHTDDWNGYNGVHAAGFVHRVTVLQRDTERALKFFPHVHLVTSLLKRWLLATHQGRVQKEHLQAYLDEYAFRFNRRRSMHVGKIFSRLMEQMVLRKAKGYKEIVNASENN